MGKVLFIHEIVTRSVTITNIIKICFFNWIIPNLYFAVMIYDASADAICTESNRETLYRLYFQTKNIVDVYF